MNFNTKFLIIDGNSLAYRSILAFNNKNGGIDLCNSKGRVTGGLFRFINSLNSVLNKIQPTNIVISWDNKAPTFRHNIFPEYKANRKHNQTEVKEFFEQLELIREVVDELGIKSVSIEGYEGDDIVGSFAKISDCDENYILSGDKDNWQLVNDKTRIIYPKNGFGLYDIVDNDYIIKKFNIGVDKYIEYKMLLGDAGDNIFGVNGCGEKTASKLLNENDNIDNILNNIDNIKLNKKVYAGLKEWKDKKELSRKLVTIVTDVPLPYKCSDCLININWDNVLPIFKKLELNSLITKIKNNEFYC